MSHARTLVAILAAVVAMALLAATSPAGAHAIGLSRGDYAQDDGLVSATLTFARGDALVLAPALDVDGDGALSETEVAAGQQALRAGVAARIGVRSGGEACESASVGASLTQGDGLLVRATYRCRSITADASVALDALLDELPSGHRHMARRVAEDQQVVLFHGSSVLSLSAAKTPSQAVVAASTAPQTSRAGALQLLRMGVEHILTGYDHLLFLLGLVLVAPRARSLLPVVTAFTVAHSLTLGVAVLGLWTPPSRIVEPLIALSIAYVGVENLFAGRVTTDKRWRLTFFFGLIHGFGFAAVLRELALPRQAIPVALLSFNLGVETGQLAVLALLVPAVLLVRRTRWLEGTRARIPSLGVAAVGAVWFVARIV